MKTLFCILALACLSASASLIAADKQVVWVDAYHPELEWSEGILDGIHSVFDDWIQNEKLTLKTLYLDTKNNPGEAFARRSASKAHEMISQLQPDLLMAGDDASAKYLIQEYYANSDLPVVFCGINFDAAKYGFGGKDSAPNVTGMIEVPPVDIALQTAAKYSKGTRYGYITFDDLSEKGNFDGIVNQFHIQIAADRVAYVSSMKAWKQAYRRLQPQVDILIMGSANFMQGWNWKDAHSFILNTTSANGGIPVTYNHWTIDIALLAYSKRASEQGEWAARAAIDILFHNKKPSDIPFGRNRQADLLLNQTLAEKLGIRFSPDDLHKGELVETPIN